jgi:hypothetical protein
VDLAGRRDPSKLLEGVLDGMTGTVSLVTIGNIHGQGEVLLDQLATLPKTPADAPLTDSEITGPQQVVDPQATNRSRPVGQPATGTRPAAEPWHTTGSHAEPQPHEEPRADKRFRPSPVPRRSIHETAPIPRIRPDGMSTQDPRSGP